MSGQYPTDQPDQGSRNSGYSSLTAPPTPALSQPQASAPVAPQASAPPPQAAPNPDDSVLGRVDQMTNGLNAFRTASMAEAGSLGAGVIANVGKIVGSDYLKSFDVDRGSLDNTVDAVRETNPVAGALGKYGTDALGALATTGSGILGMAAGGAAAGLATSTSDSPAFSAAAGAAMGGVGGAALKGLGAGASALGNVIQGTRLAGAVSNINEFADKVIGKTIQQAGGKDVNISTLLSGIKDEFDNHMTPIKDSLYAARDAAADSANNGAGITVDRSPFSSAITNLQDEATRSTSPQLNSAISTAKDVLGDGSNIPFSTAQSGVSRLKSEAAAAAMGGRSVESATLMGLSKIAEDSISNSVPPGSQVAALHNAATEYAKNVYYPIKNSNIEDAVLDRATETKYLGNILKGNLAPAGTPTVSAAMTRTSPGNVAADPDFQAKVLGAHINAIKDAVTPEGGNIDPLKFSNSLQKSMKTFSTTNGSSAFNDSVQPMVTLANVMGAAAVAGKAGLNKGMGLGSLVATGLAGGAGAALGGAPGAIAGAAAGQLLPKTPFLYSAGKMMSNPAVMALLHDSQALSRYPNADMTRTVANKIVESYHNQFNDVPTRLLPSFGISQLDK